jgi:tetratricopeptide (TPR) repeat protein
LFFKLCLTYSPGNSSQSDGVQSSEYVFIYREVIIVPGHRNLRGRLGLDLAAVLCVLFMVLAFAPARAFSVQTEESYQARRAKAFALCESNKFVDALPLLEKLHGEKPDDVAVLEWLSFATVAHSATLTNPAERKQERARARKLAEQAKAAGDNSALLKVVLEIPEDGGDMAFAGNAAVQAAMQEGEAAFAKGEMDAAIVAYGRALALDPHQYDAAVFTGDVYFKQKDHEQADKWFSRAVEIDPNREIAHRYWGDDLMAQGRAGEAKEHFISAVVAEPYNQRSWMGLSQWAKAQKMVLGFPRIVSPNQIEDTGKNQTNITINPSTMQPNAKKDGTDAWFSYTLFRAAWHGDKFKKAFPAEKEYRHSLPEETEGLQAVVEQVKEGTKKKKIEQIDPALASLVKLSDEGLLEAHVLISCVDKGISQDYPTYRDAHREKIRQYITEWVIHPAP